MQSELAVFAELWQVLNSKEKDSALTESQRNQVETILPQIEVNDHV